MIASGQVKGTALEVVRDIIVGNLLLTLVEYGLRLVGLSLFDEGYGEVGQQATVGVTHPHDGLIEIDTGFVDATELIFVHDIIVGLLGIKLCGTSHRDEAATTVGIECPEGGDTVGQALLDEVLTQVHVVLGTYRRRHIDRTLPVTLRNHLEDHQVALVERTLALQRDDHLVGDGVTGHEHATLTHGLLVNGDIDGVGGDDMELLVSRAHPVLQDILQLEGVSAKLTGGLHRLGLIEFEDLFLQARIDLDILIRSCTVLQTTPRDRY